MDHALSETELQLTQRGTFGKCCSLAFQEKKKKKDISGESLSCLEKKKNQKRRQTPEKTGISPNSSGFSQQPTHKAYSGPNTRQCPFVK